MIDAKQTVPARDFPFTMNDVPRGLMDNIGRLNDSDLAALEDELDFCVFTGIPSPRMLEIMDAAGVLDREWRGLLSCQIASPVFPKVLDFTPMASHRRDKARHRPFPDLSALPATA